MKIKLPYIPDRPTKPRTNGLSMVMDKGLGIRAAQDMIEAAGKHIDFVKLGFGTSMATDNLEDKIALYKSHGLQPYLGGTFFEACVVRNKFDAYRKLLKKLKIETCEVSDGSIFLEADVKAKYISELAKEFKVLSEVGSKDSGIFIAPQKWKKLMQMELEAGAYKVIAEARESGTVGIYRPGGKPHVQLIRQILNVVDGDNIIWEAPNKAQQVYFIKLLGANVNLGNIAPDEIISLEALRLGLRGDTFFESLPEKLKKQYLQFNEDGPEPEQESDNE